MRINFLRNRFLFLISFFFLTVFIKAQTDIWVSKNVGLPNIATYNLRGIAVNSLDYIFAVTVGQGVFVSTDAGESWTAKNNGLTNLEVSCVAVNHANEVFVGTNAEGIFKSADNGENWTKLETGLNFNSIRTILVCSNGYLLASTSFEGVIRSTDNGLNWSSASNGISGGHVLSLCEDRHGQTLAGTSFGNIYFSNTYGDGWTQSSAGLPNTTTAPVLAMIENTDDNYFAATGSGVYRSTDYGGNWNQIHTGGGNGYVHSLLLDNSDNLYIGTGSSGIFKTTDNGAVWIELNSGLTHLGIYSMTVNSNGDIFVVTGEGIFKSTPSTVSVEDETESVFVEFTLKQNYPNPFNPTTNIEYFLPSNEWVTIKVLDVLGNTIAILLEEKQAEGLHNIEFNANGFASGIYFYQMRAGSFSQTKKMLLVR